MDRWLLKTDPEDYTFEDLERDGNAVWDGVSNNLALQNIRKIKKGDQLLIYHTGAEKALVGLAEAISNPYPDPNGDGRKLVVIDVRPKKKLKRPVTLAQIKQAPALASFQLVRLPRLSVLPVSPEEWQALAGMADS